MHRITPEIMRTVNAARKEAGKPMLSRAGFEAGTAKVRHDDSNEALVSTLIAFEIGSGLMADYSSSYEVPAEGAGAGAPLQQGGHPAGATDQQSAEQQQAGGDRL